MQTLQQQLTSGKEIRKPSDDPAKVARAMQLHTDINANAQFKENINDTINWLDTTDTAIGQAGNVLQRVRELMVQAGNAAYGDSERQSIKDEINQRIDEFAQILNTSFDGKYIFGGTRGTTKPMATLEVDGVKGKNKELVYYSGDPNNVELTDTNGYKQISSKMSVEISPGVTMDYNVSAKDILEFNAVEKDINGNDVQVSKNLSQIFSNIVNHIENKNEVSKLNGNDLKDMSDVIDNFLKIRSEVGAKQNRMESAKEKNEDETFNLTSILSRTEDIDITQKTMEYATMQTVYMASLQTSAKVLQPTLLDYLR
jgi:flagellar hook-associated protein 3 FlgL